MKHALSALALAAAAAGAVTALPILGYSSSTGFLIGGFVITQLEQSPPGSSASLDAYYGTAGVIKFQPSLTLVTDNGLFETSLECRKVLNKSWFGWGNQTDPDSTAEMDYEKYDLLAQYSMPLTGNLFVTAGLDARFSTVFNREESILWDRVPGGGFNETLTAGLTGGITAVFPGPLAGNILLEARGFFQRGDASYAGVTGRARIQTRPWENGTLALAGRLHRHFNVKETPVPFTSGIGANVDFRGYSDNRFTGSVWTIAQLEVEQRLFQLVDEEGNPALSLKVAAFMEAGHTADSFGDLSMDDLHTDFGGGIRIGASDQAQMRIDAAWGDEGMVLSTGFDSAL